MLTNANQTIKYNNKLKGNNNINKKLTVYIFFYKQQLVILSQCFLFGPQYQKSLMFSNVFSGSKKGTLA